MKTVEGWETLTIEQCCEILDRKRVPISTEDRKKRIGEVPYYGANGLQGYIDGFIFDEPLILIAEDGGTFNEFATRPIAYRIYGKSWVNNHAHVLRAKKQYCQDSIFYNLEHKDIQSFIVGGTRSKLNQSALRSITLTLPTSKAEQTKIAEILSTVDPAIEQTEALIAKQQRIKTGLMQDLLTRGIDEHGNLRSEQTHQFKDSPLGRIPVEWEAVPLSKVTCKLITYGIVQPGANIPDGVPFIQTKDLSKGNLDANQMDRTSVDIHTAYQRSSIRSGDLVIGIRASVGLVAEVPKTLDDTNISRGVARLSPSKDMVGRYLFWTMQARHIQNSIKSEIKGSTYPEITLPALRSILVPVPNCQEQDYIAKNIDAVDSLIDEIDCHFHKLRLLKTSLMQDLLTGKVRVTPLLNNMETSV